MSIDAKTKKKVIREIFEQGWNQSKFDSFADFLADEVLLNFRGAEQVTNLAELKSLVAFWKATFPDKTFQILDIIAEGDLVAANMRFTATHSGEWQGIPPSGAKIMVEEMMFFRFEQGKIVELWEVYDEAAMLKQISGEAG